MTLLEATIKKNREKAINEGEEKKAIDAAKKMLELGDDVNKVAIVTGLPEAKIKSLAKRPTKDAA